MWRETEINLGTIKVGEKKELVYKWIGEEPLKVTHLESSCGCTTPEFDKETMEVKAVYKAGRIPKHLKVKGEYTTTKGIRVYSECGLTRLTFSAKVVE